MMVDPPGTCQIQLIYPPPMRPIGEIYEQWILEKGGLAECDGLHVFGDKKDGQASGLLVEKPMNIQIQVKSARYSSNGSRQMGIWMDGCIIYLVISWNGLLVVS